MAATLCGKLLLRQGWLPVTHCVRHGSKAVTRHRKPMHFLKQKPLGCHRVRSSQTFSLKAPCPPGQTTPGGKWLGGASEEGGAVHFPGM
uniref:Uncharacterized protein n=1 Tax=Anguilla anguilla TaxID=7936 RepID=A0A0E9VML7_ANGAN